MSGEPVTRELQESFKQWSARRSRLSFLVYKTRLLRVIAPIATYFTRNVQNSLQTAEKNIADLEAVLERQKYLLPRTTHQSDWENVVKSYDVLTHSQNVWDVIYSSFTQRVSERTPAIIDRARREIYLEYKNVPFIKNDRCLYFPNRDGQDMYIYETGIVCMDNHTTSFFPLTDVTFTMEMIDYLEEGIIPKDARVVRQTWEKANLDGSIDKRFSENTQVPIVNYMLLNFHLDDRTCRYLISNCESAKQFGESLERYLATVVREEVKD